MNAEIIAIGSELLTPHRSDTNSLFLTDHLNRLGVDVVYKTIVGDHRSRLTETISLALKRSDLILTIGGLGPTEDDLTRECAAAALGRALHPDASIAETITARFRARGLRMPEINLRQAMVIEGAVVLPNPTGTAPGQLRLFVFARFPHLRYMAQPQIGGLYIDSHVSDVMLNVRVIFFVLALDMLQRIFVSCLGSAKETCGIMRNETSLPAFPNVLAGRTDQIGFRNERVIEANQIADGGAHAYRVPPRIVKSDAGIRQITGKHKQPFVRGA